MNKVSYKVALGGVISSLCIFSMFVAGAVPFLYLTMPMIAGTLMSIIAVEVNKPWAFLTYASVSLLSVFITADKEAALIFILLFGYYPIIKEPIDKLKLRLIRFLIKLAFFNVVAVVYYHAALFILGAADMTDDVASFGKYGIYLFWAACNVVFFIYDYALKGTIQIYIKFLKPKIYGGK